MRRALLIGIDDYGNARFPSLAGAVNDVNALAPLFRTHADGSPNFEVRAHTTADGDVTRDGLLTAIEELTASDCDLSLLYFAGHGMGHGGEVKLVTADGTDRTPGIPFSEVLTMVAASKVRDIVVILDCCFAGAAGRVPQLGGQETLLRDGLTILAATRADEPSLETERGLFSTYLEGALSGGAADVLGRVTIAGLYAYVDESFGAWGQRPTFKTNVARLLALRHCRAAVTAEALRRLPEFFPSADAVLALDPSYEPTAEPRDPVREEMFGILQRYRAASLLEPLGTPHLYDAAMAGTGCRLTALGRHYHHRAANGRI